MFFFYQRVNQTHYLKKQLYPVEIIKLAVFIHTLPLLDDSDKFRIGNEKHYPQLLGSGL